MGIFRSSPRKNSRTGKFKSLTTTEFGRYCCGRRGFDQGADKALITLEATRIKADSRLQAGGAWSVNFGALVKSASAPTILISTQYLCPLQHQFHRRDLHVRRVLVLAQNAIDHWARHGYNALGREPVTPRARKLSYKPEWFNNTSRMPRSTIGEFSAWVLMLVWASYESITAFLSS